MPINAHPEYLAAEKEHLLAQNLEDKIRTLEKMISVAPKHKGAENLLAQLRTKLKKLRQQLIKSKKSGRGSKKGIKKEDMQAVIIGETNSGKSSLLNLLTNANPEIAPYIFTTKQPIVAMMPFSGMNIQLVENPAIESEYYDKGLTNSADTLLIIITSLEQLTKINSELKNNSAKRIIIFNDKLDLSQNELRKLEATLSSKKLNFIIINLSQGGVSNFAMSPQKLEQGWEWGGEALKEKIFQSFNRIRVFTKEPGKPKSEKPIILNPESVVKDVAEKILHGFASKVKETRVTGPSSKFPNQKVGLQHVLKDLDVVEFKTR